MMHVSLIAHHRHALKSPPHVAPVFHRWLTRSFQTEPSLSTVTLERGKARLFQDGNPLVYGGAIKEINGNPRSGDLVSISDHMGNKIGRGVFNANSTYRVRMFSRSYEKENDYSFQDLLILRVKQAIQLRRELSLPSTITTAFRIIK